MGRSEIDKATKESKAPTPANNAQETSSSTSTATVNADWPGFQAYSPIPPHGFLASSPQPHPYVWGVQPMMPPYGTPPHPYVAMYPHGVYAHPSMPPGSYPFGPFAMPSANGVADASGNTVGGAEADVKVPEGKEKLPVKRSKGSLSSLNMVTGKSNEEGKITRPSDAASSKSFEVAFLMLISLLVKNIKHYVSKLCGSVQLLSVDSGSDGTSEGSNADSHNSSPTKSRERQEPQHHQANGIQNGNGALNAPHTMANHSLSIVPPIPGPATNLNIGMDYWAGPASSAMPSMRGKVPSAPAGSGDNLHSQLWLQDERELKRQRRKQSNRESARRSRLRKQAECDELAQRADSLKDENANLRSELDRIKNEYEKLAAENASLKERLTGTSKAL